MLRTALRLADDDGIEAVSMRRLGQALHVEAMSLYKHVSGKEDILDGIADLVMEEVEVPARDLPWRQALRQSAISTYEALLRHPWAGPVLESRRNPGPTADALPGRGREHPARTPASRCPTSLGRSWPSTATSTGSR